MQLHLKTFVRQNYLAVFEAFDESLFRKLAPPYPAFKLLRFDGSSPGDVVEIELQTGFKSLRWSSLITERETTETEAWFVDQGQVLPPPLRFWRHKHVVEKAGTGAVIHDIITYRSKYRWLDVLLYPLMLAQFAYRKPVYRSVFGGR